MLSHQLDMMARDVERSAQRRLDAAVSRDPERIWLRGKVLPGATLPAGEPWLQRLARQLLRRPTPAPAGVERPVSLNTPAEV